MTHIGLASIGVRIEGAASVTGNALPVLHEILHGLRRLGETGEPLTIDLRSIPFGPGDEERLLVTLGEGEVRAVLDSLGRTDIWETRYAGVWIIDHRDAAGARVGLQVEVTEMPSLLRTPGDDIRDAAAQLDEALAAAETMPIQEGTT